MDPKEIRGLQEAYMEVYQELDEEQEIVEGLRSAVKRLLGGKKKEVEAPKPESRGEQLRKKYNVGPERSDTSAKRQILNRSRARSERDQKEYGDSKYSKSVAQQSKAAHDRYLRAGYSKYGADDARGKGNKARKRAAALNREEFDWIVDTLLDEGYDLSTYTVDEFYNICLDEAMSSYDRNRQRAAQRAAARNEARAKGQTGNVPGVGYVTSRKEKETYTDERGVDRHKTGGRMPKNEEVDLYDIILSHLLDEGYAETQEAAQAIMVNMSEEWRDSIVEEFGELDEASKTDDATRARIKMFAGKKGISFEPGPRWDASANRGRGAHLSDKQIEKQRRKKLRGDA